MNTEQSDNQPQIVVDDDWKSKVAAERALERAAARRAAREGQRDEPLSDSLPPASFEMLIQTYATQAMIAIGLVPDPVSGQPSANPDHARHFIDMLGVIETISNGNRTPQQSELLSGVLHNLRMAFVSVPQTAGKPSPDQKPTSSLLELP